MEVWLSVLFLCGLGLILFLVLQIRERFASGSVEPSCPEGLILVGKRCRADAVELGEDGQCPEGTVMNEEGSCQRQADPVCPAEYTLAYDDISAMCQPNVPQVELSDEENIARQKPALPQCPAGFSRSFLMEGEPNTRCMRDTGQTPVCPAGSTFDRDVYAWSVSEPLGTGVCFSATGPVPAKCPPNTFPEFIYFENAESKFTCMELAPVQDEPPPPPPPVETPPPAGPAPPPPPKKVNPRQEIILGPKFTGKVETVVGTDSYKTNKYPELLGGLGKTHVETKPSKSALLVADGSLPSYASLGCDENSKFLPFSRVATDLDPLPDKSRISSQFEAASSSVKPEPSPFLTDFSAFFR